MVILKNIFQKFREPVFYLFFIGALITVFFGIFTIYSVLHRTKSDISFKIINESNVLDVYRPLKDLMISFQGEDLQEKKLNIRIYTILIENNGEVDILQDYYDKDDIWGMQIRNGKIIDVRFVTSNSEYLKSKLHPQLYGDDIIKLTKLIFERNNYFILEVLVLHKKDVYPEIIPIGKIAGINEIRLTKTYLVKEKKSILTEVFYGSILVYTLRYLIYFILTIIFFVTLFFSLKKIDKMKSIIEKNRRIKRIKKFSEEVDLEGGDIKKLKLITNHYVKEGTIPLVKLEKIFSDQNNLLKIITFIKKEKEYFKKMMEDHEERKKLEETMPAHIYSEHLNKNIEISMIIHNNEIIRDLIENCVIDNKDNDKIYIDPDFEKLFYKFLYFLKPRLKMYKKYRKTISSVK